MNHPLEATKAEEQRKQKNTSQRMSHRHSADRLVPTYRPLLCYMPSHRHSMPPTQFNKRGEEEGDSGRDRRHARGEVMREGQPEENTTSTACHTTEPPRKGSLYRCQQRPQQQPQKRITSLASQLQTYTRRGAQDVVLNGYWRLKRGHGSAATRAKPGKNSNPGGARTKNISSIKRRMTIPIRTLLVLRVPMRRMTTR